MIKSSKISAKAIEVCQILVHSGHQAYLVGGCVRDLVLDAIPKDWDIATSAKPEQVKSIFEDIKIKTYDTGLQHGTITVSMGPQVEDHFEITTYRSEGTYSDGRRPDSVEFVDNIESDLSRRDFTINAIAYDPLSEKLHDPFKGAEDLKSHLVRAVGNASERFQEDGLRIMRAARFAARLGFTIEESTLRAMSNNIETLKKVSTERLSDEISKIALSSNPDVGLLILYECGALQIACPLLTSYEPFMLFKLGRNTYSGELETRLANIYCNCPSIKVQKELFNLKFSNKEIRKVVFLIDLLDKFGEYTKHYNLFAYRDFMKFLKNKAPIPWESCLDEFIKLSQGIRLAVPEMLDLYKDEIVYSRRELNISGDDLLDLQVPPGPEIKKILNQLYDYIICHPEENVKYKLLNKASKLIKGDNNG